MEHRLVRWLKVAFEDSLWSFMSHIIIVFFVLFLNLILQGNREDACYVYEQAIAIEKGKEDSQTLPFLFAQYSRFLHLVRGVCISFTSC